VHKGLKVCILFEGRDGAGKGGTIKAITERVSPRVFRVIALPAPTAREKSQMYAQRYLPHLTWKLSPMDLKSYDRWDDHTKARDEMFAATDSSWAPWFVAQSEDKKRVRLNVISHLLKHVPYKDVPATKVKLPARKVGKYKAVDFPFKYVPELF